MFIYVLLKWIAIKPHIHFIAAIQCYIKFLLICNKRKSLNNFLKISIYSNYNNSHVKKYLTNSFKIKLFSKEHKPVHIHLLNQTNCHFLHIHHNRKIYIADQSNHMKILAFVLYIPHVPQIVQNILVILL